MKKTIKYHANSTSMKTKDRRFLIIKPVNNNDKETLIENVNVIEIKALVSDVGEKPGVMSELQGKDKIKRSLIFLSDDAMFELFISLHHHYMERPAELRKAKEKKELDDAKGKGTEESA